MASRGADGSGVTSALAGAPPLSTAGFSGAGLLWDFLSRGLGGLVLSGAALPSLGGRPLPGLAALSFSTGIFCLTAFFSSLAASSRAAAKSTTLLECAGARLSLPGVGGCDCSFSVLGASGAAGSSTSARVTASAGSGTASPISKSAACPSCSSMTASASVSAGSGAGGSGTVAASTVGADAPVGGATSGMFFLSSAICKPPFRGMKKASPQTGRVEVTSLHGFIYENAARCPVGRRCS